MSLTTSWQGYTSSTLLQPTAVTTYNTSLYWCQLSPDNPRVVQCYSLAPPCTFEFEESSSSITAVSLSLNASQPLSLASAARTTLTVWRVPLTNGSSINQHLTCELECCSGEVVTQLLFSSTTNYLIACSGSKLLLFKIGLTLELCAIFEGHSLPITSLSFFPVNRDIVVTCSQDRTFRVWDISNHKCLYESPILSSSPLICIQVHPSQDVFMLGAADGSIWLYEWFSDAKKCFLTYEFDMKIHFTFSQSSKLSSQLSNHKISSPLATTHTLIDQDSAQESYIPHQNWNLTGTYFCSFALDPSDLPPLSYASPNLANPTYLIVTTESSLLIINSNTGDIEHSVNLLESLGNQITAHTQSITHAQFTHSPTSPHEYYFLAVLSPHDITLMVRFRIPDMKTGWKVERPINFQATSPLLKSSPLSIRLSAKSPSKEFISFSKPSSTSIRTNKNKPPSLDKPIVFHTKIRSSGYGQTPKNKMFVPHTATSAPVKRATSRSQPCLSRKDYLVSDKFPSHEVSKLRITKENGGVRGLSCSSDGEVLAAGLTDSAILLLSDPKGCKNLLSPVAIDKSRVLRGHTAKVESLGWSHSGKHLISASNAECLLWDVKGLKSLLSIGNSNSIDINHIQFFYLDKFILLTQGPELCLYAYALQNAVSPSDDIKRYLNLNTWKLALRATQPVHSITACSAANAFFSHIALLGLSNRSIAIHDLNADKQIGSIQLERPVNRIHQYEGSKYCGVPSDSYNLFLTSAVQEGIRAWDLRMNQCIVKYSLHRNSVMPVDCKVSPCGRFVATGSEDKCVYVYDLRGSTRVFVEKIVGFSDITTRIMFRPSLPELVVSTLDGYLHSFQ